MMWTYELAELAFDYGSGPALRVGELRIAHSRVTALVGPNGAGKTTLLNILAFQAAPARGSVRFLGSEISRAQFSLLRRRVGYVHQKPYLFNASVRRNLETGLKWRGVPAPERRRRVEGAIAEFDLAALADRSAHDLSGGESQRVALARALVLEPEVLILDEPFSHLDRTFTRQVEELLTAERKEHQHTVIFTTHDPLHAERLAEDILTLWEGQVAPLCTVNLFDGSSANGVFDTGRLRIVIPPVQSGARRIAIDSRQIVLSRERLDSSMRNCFPGRVRGLSEKNRQVQVTVDAGETFEVLITPAALQDLAIGIGDSIWLSFKSSAVHVF